MVRKVYGPARIMERASVNNWLRRAQETLDPGGWCTSWHRSESCSDLCLCGKLEWRHRPCYWCHQQYRLKYSDSGEWPRLYLVGPWVCTRAWAWREQWLLHRNSSLWLIHGTTCGSVTWVQSSFSTYQYRWNQLSYALMHILSPSFWAETVIPSCSIRMGISYWLNMSLSFL